MAEMTLKTKVPANHRLTIELDKNMHAGEEVEVVVRSQPVTQQSSRNEQRREVLKRLANSGRKAEPAELDARIQELRDSWD